MSQDLAKFSSTVSKKKFTDALAKFQKIKEN